MILSVLIALAIFASIPLQASRPTSRVEEKKQLAAALAESKKQAEKEEKEGKSEAEQLRRAIEMSRKTGEAEEAARRRMKEELEDKEKAEANVKFQEQQLIIDRLEELEKVLKQNKLKEPLSQIQKILQTVRSKHFTPDNLEDVLESLQSINGKTVIQYEGSPTTIMVLLIPLKLEINQEIEALKWREPKSFRDYYRDNKFIVDEEVAVGVLNLSDLHLTDLTDFDEEHVPGLNALRELYLWDNQLADLPESIGNLGGLVVLALSNNRLSSLPASVGNLQALTHLHLSENQFTQVPDVIGSLRALTHLCLGDNKLYTLPVSLRHLIGLLELELPRNKFTEIPDWIGDLINLDELDLNDNYLTSLPESMTKLVHLADLYLAGNLFTSPPQWLNKLPALERLALLNNPIALDDAQLRAKLELPDHVTSFLYKIPAQEKVEHELLEGIENGNAEAVRQAFTTIMAGRILIGPEPASEKIDITKIRDAKGNNLLHAVVQAVADRTKAMRTEIKNIMEDKSLSAEQKKSATNVFFEQIIAIEARYIPIFKILTQFGGPKVQTMMLAKNKNGDSVLGAAIGVLGKESDFVKMLGEYEHRPTGKPAKRFPITQPRKLPAEMEREEKLRKEREAKAKEEKARAEK